MAVVLRCSVCRRKFPWKTTEDPPEFCPFDDCNSRVASDRADDDIVMPFIRHDNTKKTDQVFRDMERGSEVRAELAAQQLGVPVSEMNGLKITNLNDRRDAEVAAMPVNNSVSQFMQAHPNAGGFQAANGVGYSGAVQTGPMPNMGAKMMTQLRQHQADISHGSAVSDRPALETQQPNYRRRG